jgi:hypothetical protein
VKSKEYSLKKRMAVVTWRKAGKSYGEISKAEKLSKSTLLSIINHWENNLDGSLSS